MVGGVGDQPVTMSGKPTQLDGENGCYRRIRGKHRQAMTFGGKDGTRAQWLCWVACGQKCAGGGPWCGRDRRRPEQGGSLVTRRGGEGHEGFGRCASAAMKRVGTEVLRGNRSRWRGGAAELFCRVGKGWNEVGSWWVR